MTYTAVEGLMLLVNSLHNGAAPGTGVYPLILWARNLLGHDLPQVLIDYNVGVQNNLFGSYPTKSDVAPNCLLGDILPDVLPGKVRAIVTAEQTYYPSSEDEDEDEEYTNTLRSTSDFESFSKQSDEVDDDLDFQASNGKTKDLPYPAEDFKPDFTKPSPAYKHGTYPKDSELDEFHF
ncbi:hypothetical protein QCA50_016215 [Cerrena zonata]|uniref:Uncharacterized protein n=1 Tax=Cerrena zonata TaxID=2478898 RepID=A0AAW0FVB5_9APHY